MEQKNFFSAAQMIDHKRNVYVEVVTHTEWNLNRKDAERPKQSNTILIDNILLLQFQLLVPMDILRTYWKQRYFLMKSIFDE